MILDQNKFLWHRRHLGYTCSWESRTLLRISARLYYCLHVALIKKGSDQSVNELRWKVEKSISTAIKVWMARITEQTTKKVSVLNKNSGIRNTNCLLEDLAYIYFRCPILNMTLTRIISWLRESQPDDSITGMTKLWHKDETKHIVHTTKSTETNISLYNKPLINSLSLVSHIYIITTIYLCCHTHFLANFRHTERGFRPQTTSY